MTTPPPVVLKPCPFCGDPMVVSMGLLQHVHQAGCPIGAQSYDEGSASVWNRRALPPHEEGAVDEECSELEQRAFNAANAEWSVAEYQQIVRDLWKACCDGSECLAHPAQQSSDVSKMVEIAEADAIGQPHEVLSILRSQTTAEVVTVWKDGTWRREPYLDTAISRTEPDYLVSIPLSELAQAKKVQG